MENTHFKKQMQYLSSFLSIAVVAVACAKVDFASQSSCTGSSCVTAKGTNQYNYSVSAATQPIDVLFVVDNSASMYTVQQQIGAKFSSLFSTLSKYDYHLAITTTDIQTATNPASSINQNGALQSGRLIQFSDGSYFLTPSSSSPTTQFSAAITRPETLSCTNYVMNVCHGNCTDATAYAQQCPSEDTRGIYAANLTIQGSGLSSVQQQFSRSNVPLAVVIISNSDERVEGGKVASMPLEALDYPSSLQSNAAALNKSLSLYPIIIQPNDSSCLQAQTFSSSLFGFYGSIYSALGNSSSICSSDFSSNLTSIGAGIATQMTQLTLYCAPVNNSVLVKYNSTGTQQTVLVSSSSPTTLTLPTPLTSGQSVQLQYACSQ